MAGDRLDEDLAPLAHETLSALEDTCADMKRVEALAAAAAASLEGVPFTRDPAGRRKVGRLFVLVDATAEAAAAALARVEVHLAHADERGRRRG